MKRKIEQQVEEYLDYCRNIRRMTEASLATKTSCLNQFIKAVDCGDLRKLDNENYNKWVETEIRRGISPQTVNDYNSKIIAMVRYFREIGMNIPLKIPLIPKYKENRKQRVFYTKEQIEEVLKKADETSGLMIRICFDTGMRRNELRNLKVSDFEGRKVKFLGKGRIWHESYLGRETFLLLKKYLQKYKVKNFLWAGKNSGKPPSLPTITKRLSEPFFESGYLDFHPHALRHSFATDLQRKGASIEEIQHMIGHSSATITENYLHGFEGERLKELFDKYQEKSPS